MQEIVQKDCKIMGLRESINPVQDSLMENEEAEAFFSGISTGKV